MQTGFIVTAGAVASWALLSAVSRLLLLRLELDPWAFSFIQLCAGGLILVLVAGRGRSISLYSFRRPTTWILGVLRVVSAALYTTVLGWLSVLETGTLGAISTPLAALGVWLVFRRRPMPGEWIGHLAILGAAAWMLFGLNGELRSDVAVMMGLNALTIVAMAILAEKHPDNLSDAPGVRLRFTGAVLLVTAGAFLAVRALQEGGADTVWDWKVLIVGTIFGITLRAPSMVLSFWAIRLVGAQNYAAANAFLPLIGMALEQAAYAAGLIDVSRFDIATLCIAVVVVSGSVTIFIARAWRTG